jgi:hypothetical protein
MTDEYESAESYSAFWPLAILIVGLLGWSGYGIYQSFSQKQAMDAEFQQGIPVINDAQSAKTRLTSLAQDLLDLSPKDTYAAQIVKAAGIRGPSTNAASASPAPAASAPSTLEPASSNMIPANLAPGNNPAP